jgi:hypothetical protein
MQGAGVPVYECAQQEGRHRDQPERGKPPELR